MAVWKILTSYELLYKWISGFDYFADQLFLRVNQSQGEIELHATPETINRICLDLVKEIQATETIVDPFKKLEQLKQIFSLPDEYQVDFALGTRLNEESLYLIEIQYANEKDVSLVCLSPSRYEQLVEVSGLDITIWKVSDFLEMCRVSLQVQKALASAQPAPGEEILLIYDVADDFSSNSPGSELSQTSRLSGANSCESTKEQARQGAGVRRGWLLPTSHRIIVPTDLVQMLLFLLGPVILTYMLQDRLDDQSQRESPNRIELALGADELDKILRWPWQMLDEPLKLRRSESTASTETTLDQPTASTVAAQTGAAPPTRTRQNSQQPSQFGQWQSEGVDFHVKQTPKGSDLLKLQLRSREGSEQGRLNVQGMVDDNQSLNPEQKQTHSPKTIQPVNFVPGPLSPAQPDLPGENDSPAPGPQPTPPEQPELPFEPGPPAEPVEYYDFIPKQFPNPESPNPESPNPELPAPFDPPFDPPPGVILPPPASPWNQPPIVTPGNLTPVDWIPVNPDGSNGVDSDGNDGAEAPSNGGVNPDKPIPVDIAPGSDDSDRPDADGSTDRPPDESVNPNNPTSPEAEDPVRDPGDDLTDKPENGENKPALPGDPWIRLNNPPGNDRFLIEPDRQYIIKNFGGVGRGTAPLPSVIEQVDTLEFKGEGLTAENMLLTQQGTDLVMQFEIANSPKIVLKDFALDLLDDLTVETNASITIGNILFNGQTVIVDAFDVMNAEWDVKQVLRPNTVTFLNGLDNVTTGFASVKNSSDIINGLAGDDLLSGLDGDDLLRGGEGNDWLDGGAGDDILNGGAGNDVLKDFFGNNQMIGGSGRDQFMLKPGSGLTVIRDFKPGEDSLQLEVSGSLSSQIEGQDTVLLFNNQPFAILQNIQTDLWGLLGS